MTIVQDLKLKEIMERSGSTLTYRTKSLGVYARHGLIGCTAQTYAMCLRSSVIPASDAKAFALICHNRIMNGAACSGGVNGYNDYSIDYIADCCAEENLLERLEHSYRCTKRSTITKWQHAIDLIDELYH